VNAAGNVGLPVVVITGAAAHARPTQPARRKSQRPTKHASKAPRRKSGFTG
jgi:hypothetical protein